MKFVKVGLGIMSLILATGVGVAQAQFKLPNVLSSLTGDSSTKSASSDTLVRTFVATNQEILTAQKFLALAYDQKDKAALLDSEVQALQSTGVGTDELKKAVELSNKTNEELTARQAEKRQFSEEEKQYYIQSLPHFVRGLAGTKQLIDQLKGLGASADGLMSGGGLSMLGSGLDKMKAAAFVVKATPGYAKGVFDTFRKTVSIARSNNIKMPADATSALAELTP